MALAVKILHILLSTGNTYLRDEKTIRRFSYRYHGKRSSRDCPRRQSIGSFLWPTSASQTDGGGPPLQIHPTKLKALPSDSLEDWGF